MILIILIFIQFASIILILFCIYMLNRNKRVYQERVRVINLGKFEALDRYTGEQMLHQFWKPVKSFYKDL